MTIHGIGVLRLETPPVRRIRLWDCGVSWRDVNPSRGVFDWDRLDAFVSEGRGLLVLGGTPQWAARNPDAPSAPWIGPGSSSPPRILKDWDAYVRAMVTRYGTQVDYQIWNEPQAVAFWNPYSQIARLGVMTRRAYDIIHRIAPSAVVAAAPVLPRPSSGGVKRGSKYLRALKANGWPVDAFTFHAYPEQGMGPDRYQWMIGRMLAALAALHAPGKPLWCTEVNYNLLHGPIPERLTRPYMLSTDRYSEIHGVDRVYWYALAHTDPSLLGIPFTPGSKGVEVLQSL